VNNKCYLCLHHLTAETKNVWNYYLLIA
jgi:hypothetical protein